MIRRVWLGLCLAVAALVALAPLASAQSEGEPTALRVEVVDARGETWVASGVSSEGLPAVSVDGEELAANGTTVDTDVVLVIDNDRGLPNATLQLAGNAAVESLLPGTGPLAKVGVVSTARQGARQELGLTADPAAVSKAIDGILADGDAATWDAIARAADLLDGSEATSKRVVAFVSAADKLSLTNAGSVATALRLAEAQLDVVVLPAGVNTTQLAEIVQDTGGSVSSIESDEGFGPAAATVALGIADQFRIDFEAPPGDSQEAQLEFSAGDSSQVVQAERGGLMVGPSALAVSQSSAGMLARLLNNSLVHWVALLLLAGAVIAFVWALLTMVLPDSDSLSRRLRAYDDAPEDEESEAGDGGAAVTTVPLLQRAVALTGEVAEKRGFLESLEVSLERASMPLRAAEALFFLSAAALLLGVAVFAFTGNLVFAVGALVLTLVIPKVLLDMRVHRRQKAFVAQLPDMLALLAGTLKAGYSITQGFEAVSREVDDPMGKELRRVVTEHRLGRTLEDALDATADRMGSEDFAWTVMAIKIQREVGGNLAELLMTVANTMTQRERLRRDVNSLTAEGRMSALILGLLPPGLGLVMYVMNRDYIMELFTPGLGYVMVGAAVIAMGIGFAWMKKIITIEV